MRNTGTALDRRTNPFSEVSEGKLRNTGTVFDRTTNPFSEGEVKKRVAVFDKSYIPVFREE